MNHLSGLPAKSEALPNAAMTRKVSNIVKMIANNSVNFFLYKEVYNRMEYYG